MKRFIAIGIALNLFSCVSGPRPIQDLAIARAAIEAARLVEAPRHSPSHLKLAEDFYLQGQKHMEARDYSRARRAFAESRKSAERAENTARVQRQKLGEDF